MKLKSTEETEINANGPVVSKEDFARLVEYFEGNLQLGDVVFLAGNAGNGWITLRTQRLRNSVMIKALN